MIDLISFNKALKTTWIKKYLDTTNNAKWEMFFDLAPKHYGSENVFAGNLNIKDTTTSIKATDQLRTTNKIPGAVSRTKPMAQLSN